MLAALTGFVAGSAHVMTGPDHLAAVAPLSMDRRGGSWTVGLRWGLGHSAGVLILGLLLMALKESLPIDRFSFWAERMVGVVLIGIGLWGLRKAMVTRLHSHTHTHDGHDHIHVHVHGSQSEHHPKQNTRHAHRHTVFAVGILHGLAGGSHILTMLPALAYPSRIETAAYLASYVVGTIASMCAFASLVGYFAGRYAEGSTRVYQIMMSACSVIAILLGGYWLWPPVGA